MDKPSIYAVIVTFNGAPWIEKCINSLLESELPVSIIVVDNSSSDNTIELLAEFGDSIILLKQSENLGFGKANNVGIRHALNEGASYVLLLNQDAYLFGDSLSNLVEVYECANEKTCIISPLHYSPQMQLDFLFRGHLERNEGKEFPGSLLNSEDIYLQVKFANAACWFIPSKTLKCVGAFNPLFTHYGEDNDYINRLHFKGGKVLLSIKSGVIHDREQASPKLSLKKRLNREFVSFLKHGCNPNMSIIMSLWAVFLKWAKESIFYILTLKPKHFLALQVGFIKVLTKLTEITHARQISNKKGAYL